MNNANNEARVLLKAEYRSNGLVQLSHESVELSNEPVQLSNNAVELSDELIQLSNEAVGLSNKRVQLPNGLVELSNKTVQLSNELVQLFDKRVDLLNEVFGEIFCLLRKEMVRFLLMKKKHLPFFLLFNSLQPRKVGKIAAPTCLLVKKSAHFASL